MLAAPESQLPGGADRGCFRLGLHPPSERTLPGSPDGTAGHERSPRSLTVALGSVGHAEEQGRVAAELRGEGGQRRRGGTGAPKPPAERGGRRRGIALRRRESRTRGREEWGRTRGVAGAESGARRARWTEEGIRGARQG